MSNLMDYTKLESVVKKHLKPSRFEHSKGVAKVCSELSTRFLLDKEAGLYTGIFHDYARYYSDSEILKACRKGGVDISKEEEEKPMLLHGAAAALVMRDIVGDVTDSYLIAIRNHTLGSINMGLLGACLYVADYTEPNRKHLDDKDRKEILSLPTLEEMVLNILEREKKYYKEKGMTFANRTIELYNFLLGGGLFNS